MNSGNDFVDSVAKAYESYFLQSGRKFNYRDEGYEGF